MASEEGVGYAARILGSMPDSRREPRSTGERPDANRVALRAVRAILDAAEPIDLTVEGNAVHVGITRLPPAPWPAGGLLGLDPAVDGPLPGAVRLDCQWAGGGAKLLLTCGWWSTQNRYRHLIGIRLGVTATKRELVWITVARALQGAEDGSHVPISAACSSFGRKDEENPQADATRARGLKAAVGRSGIPLLSDARVLAFGAEVPGGSVHPSPREAFARLVHLALLKLPFVLRAEEEGIEGEPPFVRASEPTPYVPPVLPNDGTTSKLSGLYPLPGGVRKYKTTLDEMLDWHREGARGAPDAEGRSMEAFLAMLEERYGAAGPVATTSYLRLLTVLGFVEQHTDDTLTLTDSARAYLSHPSPSALFERLHATFDGMMETLAIAAELRAAKPTPTKRILATLLDKEWKTENQSAFRRNWLLSLGLTTRSEAGDALTDLGRDLLGRHPEASDLRRQIAIIIAEDPTLAGDVEYVEEDDPSDPPIGLPLAPPHVEPPSWMADRLDLYAAIVRPHLGQLELPPVALDQVCAALSAGKHLLLVGPPGTGKTELANALASTAQAEGYCHGAFVATASADWTTFDTIGGYALQKDGALRFRSGVFLQAIERWQWLIIDELNRADVDRAFGELMTVLAGRSTDTSFELDDERHVSIGPDARCSHRLPPSFRVIATMNTWDKTSLFRLSYAVQRRFAIVHVGIPDDPTYAGLIDRHGGRPGIDPPLAAFAAGPLKELFCSSGLFAHRSIGPAVLLDMLRYMRRRGTSGDGLAEALAMYLLPQLEGLDQVGASTCFKKLGAALNGWTTAEAIAGLHERYRELFPHVKLPEA